MSLFEKFVLMFEADAGQLTAEIDKAEENAKGLSAELDKVGKIDTGAVKQVPPAINKATTEAKGLNRELSKGQQQAQRMGQSFLSVARNLAAPVLAFASITGAVAGAMARASEIDSIAKSAQSARMAVGEFDAFGRAARNLGGEASSAQSNIKNLSDKAIEAVANKGSEAAKIFKQFGINLKDQSGHVKDTSKVLLDLAEKSEKLNKAQALNNLRKLGITDPGTIKLIMSGKKALLEHMEAQKKTAEITEEQVAAAQRYKQAQNELGDATTGVANELVGLFLPSITSVIKGLTVAVSWCRENKNVVTAFFAAIATIVTVMYLPAMASAATATLAATWPLLAIIAACAAFALVLDDVMAYLNGQPSILGDLAAKYPAVAEALRLIGVAWEWVVGLIKDNIAFLQNVWSAIVALWNGDIAGFKEAMSAAFSLITDRWKAMWEGFKGIVDVVVQWIKKELWNMLPNWAQRWLGGEGEQKRAEQAANDNVTGNGQQIRKLDGKIDKPMVPGAATVAPSTIQPAQAQIAATSTTPIPANVSSKVDVRKETHVTVEAPVSINNTVDTEAAVQQAAAQVGANLKREMQRAVANVDDGVAG